MKTIALLFLAAVLLLAACSTGPSGSPGLPPTGTAAGPGSNSPTPTAPTHPTDLPQPPPRPTPPAPQGAPADLNTPAAIAAQSALAQKLNLAAQAIRIVSVEAVEWPDACLGVQRPGIMCAQVVTSGYRVILEANGQQYEYHTDQNGSSLIQATSNPFYSSSATQTSGPVTAGSTQTLSASTAIIWKDTASSPCRQVQIGPHGAAAGPCSSAGALQPFISPERTAELQHFTGTFQSFKASTPAGWVDFSGQGSQTASFVQQRSIAAWARMVAEETVPGTKTTSAPVLTWHREGGIAGFCDDLAVYESGVATASSCRGNNPKMTGETFLTEAQLKQLYSWLDLYKSISAAHDNGPVPDSMKVSVTVFGSGQRASTQADQGAAMTFASAVFQQIKTKQP